MRTISVLVTCVVLAIAGVASAQKVVSPPPQGTPPPSVALPSPSPNTKELSSPQEPNPNGGKQSPAADERGTQDNPLIVKVFPSGDTNEEPAWYKKDREQTTSNEWSLNRGLIIVGCLQLLVFGLQGFLLYLSVKEMREARAIQNYTLNTTKYIADRGLRAHLQGTIDPTSVVIQTSKPLSCGIFVENRGHTLARDVNISGLIDFKINNSSEYIKYNSSSVIYAGDKHNITMNRNKIPTIAEINSLFPRNSRLYIYGLVEYIDVFQDTPTPRYTQFRMMNDGNGYPMRFVLCAEGNETT